MREKGSEGRSLRCLACVSESIKYATVHPPACRLLDGLRRHIRIDAQESVPQSADENHLPAVLASGASPSGAICGPCT